MFFELLGRFSGHEDKVVSDFDYEHCNNFIYFEKPEFPPLVQEGLCKSGCKGHSVAEHEGEGLLKIAYGTQASGPLLL